MPYVNLADQRLFHSQWDGDPAKQRLPLVLVHGAGGTHLHWPPGLRRLRHHNVYALDLPGHGHSRQQGRVTIEDYCQTLKESVDTLALPPFVLAGHSMGGAIAQEYALRHPERLAGLVLVGTGARLRVHPAILQGVQEDFASAAKVICDWAICGTSAASHRRLYLRALLDVDPAVLLGDFHACDAFDVRQRLAQISVPTLVLCGDQDQLTPLKYSEYLQAHIPGARLVVVENAGHMVMLERPQKTAEAISSFLQGLELPGPMAAPGDQAGIVVIAGEASSPVSEGRRR